VPATDDEVMEVEDLLEDDKSERLPVAGAGQNVGYTSNDGCPPIKTQFNGSEGLFMYLCFSYVATLFLYI